MLFFLQFAVCSFQLFLILIKIESSLSDAFFTAALRLHLIQLLGLVVEVSLFLIQYLIVLGNLIVNLLLTHINIVTELDAGLLKCFEETRGESRFMRRHGQ